MAPDLNLLFRPEHRFFEFQGQVFAQVAAALRATAAPAAAAEQVAHAEDAAENVAEIAEVLEDGGIEAARAHAVDAGVPEAVVAGALVGVGQHGIGFAALLELLLRVGIVRDCGRDDTAWPACGRRS